MDLTLQHLRLLREVSRRTTIAAAADSLGYTRSAVSQQLVGLERSTGVAVLERVGRGVRLTDAGRELVRHADQLLAGMEAAQASLERVAGEVRGELELGLYPSVAMTMLPQILETMAALHPDVTLRSREVEPDRATELVVSGELDLTFDIAYDHSPAPVRDDVVRTTVFTDRFHLVVATSHPDFGTHTESVRLADLEGHAFIAPSPETGCGRCVVHACRDAGFEPFIAHQIDDYATTLRLVGADQGIALVSDLGLIETNKAIRVIKLAEPLTRTIQVAYRHASAERLAITALTAVIAEVGEAIRLNLEPETWEPAAT